MDLFEKIKLIIDTQWYIAFDVANIKQLAIANYLNESDSRVLHLTDLKSPNDHMQILPDDTSVIDAKFSPDDSWIAVPVDYEGNEYTELFRISTTSTQRPIPLERISTKIGRHLWMDWSPDGMKIARFYSDEDKSILSIIENKRDSDETILWQGSKISLTGQWKHPNFIKFSLQDPKTTDCEELIVNVTTKEIVAKIPIVYSWSFFGSWHPSKLIFPYLVKGSDELAIYDIESKESSILPRPNGEIERTEWSLDGEILYATVTQNARDKIYAININTKDIAELPLPRGVNKILKIRKVDNDEILYFLHADATTRLNLWLYNIKTKEYKQLTKKRSPVIGTDEFPLSSAISEHWNSFDGLEIQGFVMMPPTPSPEGGYPAVVVIHGGPADQEVDTFVGFYQILTQEGFVVFRPNFRGSTGFGEAFMKSNYQELGKADLMDIVTGIEMIIKKYQVNPKKVIAYGGSYGGYMTLRMITKPEVFEICGGWAEAAISDWEYVYDKATDEIFKQVVVLYFGPLDNDENRALVRESSPIHDWEKVSKPLGVVQLANDTRTPLKPVLDFVTKLYDRGDNVEFHIYPSMGHTNTPKDFLTISLARPIQFFKKIIEQEK